MVCGPYCSMFMVCEGSDWLVCDFIPYSLLLLLHNYATLFPSLLTHLLPPSHTTSLLTHLPPHTQLYLKSRRCYQTSVIRTISSSQSLQTGVSVVASTLMYSRPFSPPWQSDQQTPPPTLCALEIKSARFCNASFARTFCLASLKLGRSRQCLQRLLSLHDRSLARGWNLRVQRLCTTSSRMSYRTGRRHSL